TCLGSAVNFTNTSTYAGTSAANSFWNFGDGTTSNLDNPSHTFPGTGTYNVQLIAFSSYGCSDTVIVPVQIQMAINPAFSFTANCAGSVAQFNDNSTVPGGNITMWQWNFGDGGTSVSQNPTHIYATAGTYSVILSVTSNNGCTGGDTIQVTINPLPVANFTSAAVCFGTATALVNTSSIASGSLNSFAWDFNSDGITDNTLQNPNWIFPASGTVNVTLTVTSNLNCSANHTGPVVVYPQPVAAFATNNVCEGLASNFSNTTTIASPGIISSIQWTFGDGGISAIASPAHTYANDGTFNVTLSATSSNGCVGTYNSPITIYPAPAAVFTAPGVCKNNATVFSNTSNVSSGSVTGYNWDFNNDGITDNTSANPNYVFPTDGAFNVQLTVTTNNGCTANTSVQVTVFPLPVANFVSGAVCSGNASNFTNTSAVSSGSVNSVAWDFNSDGITDNTTQNPNWLFSAYGTMNVTLTATTNNNCSANFTGQTVVHPLPVAAFTVPNNCEGLASVFTNNSTIPTGNIGSVQWNFGDATYSSLNNPIHSYLNDGTFNVTVSATSAFGCIGNYTSVITIYPAPTVSFTAPGVCKNIATAFTNSSSVNSGSITGYAWDFTSDGTIDNTSANPSNVYATDGTFPAHLTVTTNFNCTAAVTIVVTVYPLPVTNFVANGFCLGIPTNFTDVTTVSSGSITMRKWDFNSDGFIDFTGLNPTYIYPGAGTQNPTLLTWTNNNCTNANQKVLFINPIPQVSFTVNDPAGCPQHCVNFSNFSTVGSGTIIHYDWNFGDNSSHSTAINPQHCYNTGNYSVTLTATSDSGCVGTATMPNMITVYPSPTAGFSYNPGEPDVLEPLISITDQSSGANNWQYDFGDATNSTLENPQHLYATEIPTSYTVTQIVSNTFGCYDTAVQVIEIKPAYTLYVPNAFTPNEDGKNDIFKAEGLGIKEFQMWIFDRWGNMIFFSDEMGKGWDGKVQNGRSDEVSQIDVFEWKVIAKDINDKSHSLLGSVTLVK
ncbi:MAG: PKD domain-containing protein, partial [Bacteroidia bacterium]|nr:PKD domain-containing protein [Bacteroidia bacterium]